MLARALNTEDKASKVMLDGSGNSKITCVVANVKTAYKASVPPVSTAKAGPHLYARMPAEAWHQLFQKTV